MIINKLFVFLIIGSSVFFSIICNPSSELIKAPLWNSLHNSKPYQSGVFHSAYYRFPHNACDEPQCHAKSLTGGNSGAPSCYNCHNDQWTIFSVSHTKQISGYFHRYDVDDYPADRNVSANRFISCEDVSCHGANLSGNQGPMSPNFNYRYSCTGCHTRFGTNIPPPGHNTNMEGGRWHHYNYDLSFSYCSGNACHGTNESTTGTASSAIPNLAGHGPACNTCHP